MQLFQQLNSGSRTHCFSRSVFIRRPISYTSKGEVGLRYCFFFQSGVLLVDFDLLSGKLPKSDFREVNFCLTKVHYSRLESIFPTKVNISRLMSTSFTKIAFNRLKSNSV